MNQRPILKNKLYLYMTEFFSGVAVMAVELGASRLLAPYFSSSQIVWTIIIGTIMIAMALGNLYGGRTADRDPNPDRLYRRILIAAVWIALIPVVGKYVILAVSAALIFTVSTNFLIIAAFAACMILFVYPLFLLGTVTPSLVKYTTDSLEDNGRIVGNMEAFNTVGSILGTFLPTFVTIPAVGTSVTFLLFSGILLALGLAYFLSSRSHRRSCAAALIAVVLCAVFGHRDSFAFWEDDLLYEGESVYNYLQVKETEDSVIFSTNVLFGVQSVRQKDGGLTGMYYDTALAAPLMAGIQDKDTFDILILGMGSGTYAAQCQEFFGGREDLRRGILRHVDDRSFPEDPLRVLRGAQFAARFGFTVAEETVALCRTMDLSALSRERVEGELQKALLQAPRPSIFFRTLDIMHQLRPWFTEVQRLQGVPQPPRYHGEGDVWEHTMAVLDTAAELRPKAAQPMALMLAALAHDFGKVVATTESGGVIHAYGHEEAGLPLTEDFLHRVIGEKALHRCVKNLVALHMKPNAMALSGASVKSTNRLLDAAIEPEDLILLALADHRGSRCDPPRPDPEPFLRQRLEIYRAAMARPMVTGSDLISAGLTPDRDFSQLLAYARKLHLAGAEREAALRQTLAYARKLQKTHQKEG